MSYLLFMDESGHDHGVVPYEVRGGIALHDSDLWQFVRSIQAAELANFGGYLHQFGSEIKGMKLLKNRVFKWANQGTPLEAEERRRLALAFLNKGAAQQTRRGQNSQAMAKHASPLWGMCFACFVNIGGLFLQRLFREQWPARLHLKPKSICGRIMFSFLSGISISSNESKRPG
jgi:hypothetical protein